MSEKISARATPAQCDAGGECDMSFVRSALETLANPLMIEVDDHLTGSTRTLAVIDRMRDIAATALLNLPAASQPQPSNAGSEPVAWREIEIVRLIDLLRSQEGDDVTILCDNPDFNGQPNCAVLCNGDWTEWKDHRFVGDTVLDALSSAATEYNLRKPREVIAESNGHHWVERFNLTCCRDCGIVRRADDKNSQCKGVVRVGPRTSPPSMEMREALKLARTYVYRAYEKTSGDELSAELIEKDLNVIDRALSPEEKK